jgi:hypothetical protein
VRDADPVLCVIEGRNTHIDGRTGGLSLPLGEAQRALIERMFRERRRDPVRVRRATEAGPESRKTPRPETASAPPRRLDGHHGWLRFRGEGQQPRGRGGPRKPPGGASVRGHPLPPGPRACTRTVNPVARLHSEFRRRTSTPTLPPRGRRVMRKVDGRKTRGGLRARDRRSGTPSPPGRHPARAHPP